MAFAGGKYRLLLDARGLAGGKSGVGRYITRLAAGIAAMQPDDIAVKMLCLAGDTPPGNIPVQVLGSFYSGATTNTIKQHLVMPPRLVKLREGIYHYPCLDLPLNRSPHVVVTCHDIEPLVTPEFFSRKIVLYYRVFARRLRSARNIIAISQKTADDLVGIIGIDERRIRTIHLGVDEYFQPVSEKHRLREMRRAYSLPEDYLLYVGNTMPHKNLERLVLAFSRIHADFPEASFAIAGAPDAYRHNVNRVVRENGLGDKVRFLGRIPEEDLPSLYSGCRLFTFPSLYEGFGLPVLEAMACGAPVLASTAGSLPEVVGDAGILVDPYDVDAISDAISRVLSDSSLAKRLSEAGIRQAAGFTWENCARSHLSLYRQILKKEI